MSFILDALRKSENERLKSETPKITNIPYAIPTNNSPIWLKVLISILCLSCFGLIWLWLNSKENNPQQASIENLIPASPITDTTNNNSIPIVEIKDINEEVDEYIPTDPINIINLESEELDQIDIPIIPTYMEAKAKGIALPVLNLELHVFSIDPENSFVRINSRSFREGEYMSPEGVSIIEINESGVIGEFQSQGFLLSLD